MAERSDKAGRGRLQSLAFAAFYSGSRAPAARAWVTTGAMWSDSSALHERLALSRPMNGGRTLGAQVARGIEPTSQHERRGTVWRDARAAIPLT